MRQTQHRGLDCFESAIGANYEGAVWTAFERIQGWTLAELAVKR